MERPFYLLTYDITNPKRLAKIAKAMEAVGERVQDSVFEAHLAGSELDRLLKKVRKIIKESEDSVRIYQICLPCKSKILCLGKGHVTKAPGTMIV